MRTGHVLILAAFVTFLAFPFYWMVLTTFKQTHDLIDTQHNPFVFNLPPTLDNLRMGAYNNLAGFPRLREASRNARGPLARVLC